MAFRTNKVPVLQTKSASGSVATFNTALAMPLPSCNIAVNAWQEGSGDPSPVNNRPIHGFSEVNVTRAGKNLLPFYKDIDFTKNRIRYYTQNGNLYLDGTSQGETSSSDTVFRQNFDFYLNKGTYTISRQYASMYVYKFVGDTIAQIAANSSPTFTLTERTHCFIGFYVYQTTYDNLMQGGQVNAGSSALPYEPCVTPTIYTIQLGQDVYGGSYNSVSGVKSKTKVCIDLGDLTWLKYTNGIFYNNAEISNADISKAVICDIYKYHYAALPAVRGDKTINLISYYGTRRISIYDEDLLDLTPTEFKTYVTGHKCVYELETPIESNIGATPISTNIGSNTIFADTGDIDLTYNDLDLAKRGSFREVFRLPS